MRWLCLASIALIVGCTQPPALGGAPDLQLVSDGAGVRALRTAIVRPHTVVDTLTGEELALALTSVVQVRIDSLPLATPGPVRVLSVLRGVKPRAERLAVPPDIDGLMYPGATPIVAVYFVHTGAVVMNAISAVGYLDDRAISYRSTNGELARYPLAEDNIFGCLARKRDPDGCERRMLRRYGIGSPARLSAFRRLRSDDPLSAALWFLVFRNTRRPFPDRVCGTFDKSSENCASYARFKSLSNFSPSS